MKIIKAVIISLLPLFFLCFSYSQGELQATQTNATDKTTVQSEDENPLFPVKLNGKFGFIDRTGKIIIEPQFDGVWSFSEGLALVWNGDFEDGNRGYIDKTGKYVINPPSPGCASFFEGVAAAKVSENGTKWGYIDKTGKFDIQPQFDFALDFSEGLAGIKICVSWYPLWGFINHKGEIVIRPRYDLVSDFTEGLARATVGVWTRPDWRTYYIDKAGKWVVSNSFISAGDFSEGLANICEDYNKKYGFIDKTGKYVIEPQFDSALKFSDGLAPVACMADASLKFGYIDKKGTFIILPQFSKAYNFNDGLALVRIDRKWKFINKTGKTVIDSLPDGVPISSNKTPPSFWHGLAYIPFTDKTTSKTKFALIDKIGKVIFTCEFWDLTYARYSY